MTLLNEVIAAWDAHKLASMKKEFDELTESITAIERDSDQLTIDIQSGSEELDKFNNVLADGEDLYHTVLSGLRIDKDDLGRRIAALQGSLNFTRRSLTQ